MAAIKNNEFSIDITLPPIGRKLGEKIESGETIKPAKKSILKNSHESSPIDQELLNKMDISERGPTILPGSIEAFSGIINEKSARLGNMSEIALNFSFLRKFASFFRSKMRSATEEFILSQSSPEWESKNRSTRNILDDRLDSAITTVVVGRKSCSARCLDKFIHARCTDNALGGTSFLFGVLALLLQSVSLGSDHWLCTIEPREVNLTDENNERKSELFKFNSGYWRVCWNHYYDPARNLSIISPQEMDYFKNRIMLSAVLHLLSLSVTAVGLFFAIQGRLRQNLRTFYSAILYIISESRIIRVIQAMLYSTELVLTKVVRVPRRKIVPKYTYHGNVRANLVFAQSSWPELSINMEIEIKILRVVQISKGIRARPNARVQCQVAPLSILMSVAVLQYVCVVDDEMGTMMKKTPEGDDPLYKFDYGYACYTIHDALQCAITWSFIAASLSFLCIEGSALIELLLFLRRYPTLEDKMKIVPGLQDKVQRAVLNHEFDDIVPTRVGSRRNSPRISVSFHDTGSDIT
uniref:Odorant receptor n=1 Tax=Romanomermis culicivorax TaxID=13658 RepID=A0A915HWF0_ROMCU